MTVVDNQKRGPNVEEESKKMMLNISDAWKKMYFDNEGVLAKAVDEFIAGQSFTEFLDQMGSQYLSTYKTATHNLDRFFANHPYPTTKDLARISELIIAVEEKVDQMESEITPNIGGLASSLFRLVEFQTVLKDEILAIRREVQSTQKQLLQMQRDWMNLAIPAVRSVGEESQPRSIAELESKKAGEGTLDRPVPAATLPVAAKAPARPRVRSNKTTEKK